MIGVDVNTGYYINKILFIVCECAINIHSITQNLQ